MGHLSSVELTVTSLTLTQGKGPSSVIEGFEYFVVAEPVAS